MNTTNYYNFTKQMLSQGYTWDEIEYYWRHQNELEEDYVLTAEQQEEKAMWERIAMI